MLGTGHLAKALRRALPIAATAVFATAAAAQDVPAELPMTSQSLGGRNVITRPASYNYEPNAFKEGSTYHLYWCGGVAGDYILHVQSQSAYGPWKSPTSPGKVTFIDTSLKPTGSPADFDGQQTCDPAVIKLYGYYYLYYTGLNYTNGTSAIGVAASRDPVHFGRLNGGRAIVNAAKTRPDWNAQAQTRYGAGQPAVLYIAPYVYLSFTDTTAVASDKPFGGGQFVLRSKDPAFQSGIQELTAAGWSDRRPGVHTGEYSIMDAVAIDWAYDDRTGKIVVLTSTVAKSLRLTALDPATFQAVGIGSLPMDWREGPGILATADRRMPGRETCASMPVAAFAGSGASLDPYSWKSIALTVSTFDMGALCPDE